MDDAPAKIFDSGIPRGLDSGTMMGYSLQDEVAPYPHDNTADDFI